VLLSLLFQSCSPLFMSFNQIMCHVMIDRLSHTWQHNCNYSFCHNFSHEINIICFLCCLLLLSGRDMACCSGCCGNALIRATNVAVAFTVVSIFESIVSIKTWKTSNAVFELSFLLHRSISYFSSFWTSSSSSAWSFQPCFKTATTLLGSLHF
jgi:hypothetical protein